MFLRINFSNDQSIDIPKFKLTINFRKIEILPINRRRRQNLLRSVHRVTGERLTVIAAAHAVVDAHIVIVMIRLFARRQRRWRNLWVWVRIRVGRIQLECVVVLFAAGVAVNGRFWVRSWVWSFCNGTSKIIVGANWAWRRPRLVFLRRFRSRQCQRLCLKG